MIKIPLTRGMCALISAEDAELAKLKWHAHEAKPGKFYASRRIWVDGSRRRVYLHREIVGAQKVDHADGDTLNCQRWNLRPATEQENSRNRSAKRQYKGAFPSHGRFYAQIVLDRRPIYLGMFATVEEAAIAYDHKAKELFGEFARLNFPTAA